MGLLAFGVLGAVAAVTRPNGSPFRHLAAGSVALILLGRAMARAGLVTPPAAPEARPETERGWRTNSALRGLNVPSGVKAADEVEVVWLRSPGVLPQVRPVAEATRAFRRDPAPGRPARPAPTGRNLLLTGAGALPRRRRSGLGGGLPAGPPRRRRRPQSRPAARARLAPPARPGRRADPRPRHPTPFVTAQQRLLPRRHRARRCRRSTPHDWTLRIHGMVDRQLELSFDDLLRAAADRARHHPDLRLQPGRRPVRRQRPLARRAAGRAAARGRGPARGADQSWPARVDGLTIGTPLEAVIDGRDAMLAVGMNGEPLPVAHGFPVRMVVPGLYGYVSATKWLVDLEVTTFADRRPTGPGAAGPSRRRSRPPPGSTCPSRFAAGHGRARAGRRRRLGAAPRHRRGRGPRRRRAWQEAELAAVRRPRHLAAVDVEWDADARAAHRLEVRATDGTGRRRSRERAPPVPDGATGWHSVVVTVDLTARPRDPLATDPHQHTESGRRVHLMNTTHPGPHSASSPRTAARRRRPAALPRCGSDDSGVDAAAAPARPPRRPSSASAPARAPTQPFGAALLGRARRSGKGSFAGMAADPVATAASNNPALSTLVTAVKKAGLVDTLNTPRTSRCSRRPTTRSPRSRQATLNKVLADKKTLTKILTYHVVGRQGSRPSRLARAAYKTLQGGTVTISGSGEAYKVNGDANVVCGNVQTANATVYIIDTVLMPKM